MQRVKMTQKPRKLVIPVGTYASQATELHTFKGFNATILQKN